jgi:hypothetical protein
MHFHVLPCIFKLFFISCCYTMPGIIFFLLFHPRLSLSFQACIHHFVILSLLLPPQEVLQMSLFQVGDN